ncbi:hypothetical protein ACVWXU_006029 [Streptomyces sp. TE33382]
MRAVRAPHGIRGCRPPVRAARARVLRRFAPAAREPPGPGAYAAAPGRLALAVPGAAGVRGVLPPERVRSLRAVPLRVRPVAVVPRGPGVAVGGGPAVRVPGAVRVLLAVAAREAVGSGDGARVRRGGLRPGHPQMPLAVRRGRQGDGAGPRGEPERRFAEPQQRAGDQRDRTLADLRTVQRGAVRRAGVGDRDPAVLGDRHRAVQPGHVRVVERDIGVGGAADQDLPAVQQMDAARVGPGDHMQLRRNGGVRRLVLAGYLEGEHRAVHEGRIAEGDALCVEPLASGEQHHRSTAQGALGPRDGRGQAGGDGGERRPGGGGDEHVAGARRGLAAARREDGQPDLHRRQRSLLRGVPGRGNAL